MKENAIKKINVFGKVTSIIAKIFKILCFVGAGLLLATTIVIACLPNDLAKITVKGTAAMQFNIEKFGAFPESIRDDIENEIMGDNASTTINGMDEGVVGVEVSETTIDINTESKELTYHLHDLIPFLLCALLSTAVMISTVIFVEQFCKSLRNCESPFEDNVIKKMRNLAFAMIPWAVLDMVTSGIMALAFGADVQINVNINLGMIIVVLVILGLSFIFKYGAVLQKESDETL